jgi:hypothetical protein
MPLVGVENGEPDVDRSPRPQARRRLDRVCGAEEAMVTSPTAQEVSRQHLDRGIAPTS